VLDNGDTAMTSIAWISGVDVDLLVAETNQIRRQHHRKVSFAMPGSSTQDELLETFASAIQFPTEVPEQRRKAALSTALSQVTPTGHLTKDEIIKGIETDVQVYLQLPLLDFCVHTTWSIDLLAPLVRSTIIDSVRVSFPDRPRKFSQDVVKKQVKSLLNIETPAHYRPVLVHVRARCEYAAIDKGIDTSDTLRGLANFSLNYRSSRRTLSGLRKPVNQILPGPVHTVHNKDGTLVRPGVFWYDPRHAYHQQPRPAGRSYHAIGKSMLLLKRTIERSKVKDVAQEGLLRYTRALDNPDWEASFFHLWGALESVTFTNSPRSSYEDTIRRASFLFARRALARQTLKHLRDRRNAYTHRAAEHGNPEILIMQLKWYVEALLRWLIANPHRFQSKQEFQEFLDAPDDVGDIDRKIQVLRCARITRL
jgi:hypothetical protein